MSQHSGDGDGAPQASHERPQQTPENKDRTSIDARESKGFINKAFGPVTQYFGTVVQAVDEKLLKRLGLETRAGFALLGVLVIITMGSVGLALFEALRPKENDWCKTSVFKIAIAEFAESGGKTGVGRDLANTIYLNVQDALDELGLGFKAEVRGPDRVGVVSNDAAEQTMQRLCASVLVYGHVDTSGSQWAIAPQFSIATDAFEVASELVGQSELGSPILAISQSKDDVAALTEEKMSARIKALALIVRGLVLYSSFEYDTALQRFQAAEKIPGWKEVGEGKEVLYLFIASTAGKTKNYALTEEAINKTLTSNPDYARAYITLGSLSYIRALERFEASQNRTDIDVKLLREAITVYDKAASMPNPPPGADVGVRAHFGKGQAYLNLAYASGDVQAAEQAAGEFEAVIAAYNQGQNARLRELAAESHARLGLLHKFSGNTAEAVAEYENAIGITLDPVRKQSFEASLKEIQHAP